MAQQTSSSPSVSEPSRFRPAPVLRLPNRVWLARFGSSQSDPTLTDWGQTGADHLDGLPPLWQPTCVETTLRWPGSRWDGRRRGTPDFSSVPMIGDRVVVARTSPHNDVLGLWIITGVQFNQRGLVRFSHRPLIRFDSPVKSRYLRDVDPDIRASWRETFGVGARGRFLVELAGRAFFGFARSSGIDPDLLVGPVADLPDEPRVVSPPRGASGSPSRLTTTLDPPAQRDASAFFAAVSYLFRIGCASPEQLESDAGAVRLDLGMAMTAREANHVGRFVALAGHAPSGPLRLDPAFVVEAREAIDKGEEWALIVTWFDDDLMATVYYPPQEVVRCFSAETGRQRDELEDVLTDDWF